MIQSGIASFVVHSTATVPEDISEALGLDPTSVRRSGDVLRSGRPVEHHTWSLDVHCHDNDEDDRTGTRPLRELLDLCGPAEGKIEILPDDCEARIWWSAYSDSVQGGFVLPIEISRRIVALGVDVYATVYLSGEDGGEER